MICILCNTTFMAMEHHGQSDGLTKTLQIGNYVNIVLRVMCCMYCVVCGVTYVCVCMRVHARACVVFSVM